MSGHSIPGTISIWSESVVNRTWHCPHTYTHKMGGKAYMMVHCTISILVSTYGVPTHSGDGRNLENFQTQTQSGLGKVCTLERRSENGDNCFYEPECAPKCVDIGVKVRNSKDEKHCL